MGAQEPLPGPGHFRDLAASYIPSHGTFFTFYSVLLKLAFEVSPGIAQSCISVTISLLEASHLFPLPQSQTPGSAAASQGQCQPFHWMPISSSALYFLVCPNFCFSIYSFIHLLFQNSFILSGCLLAINAACFPLHRQASSKLYTSPQ